MDRLDVELIVLGWADASEDDKRSAASWFASYMRDWLAQIEADLPDVAEAVRGGAVSLRDMTILPSAYEACDGVAKWRQSYPGWSAKWDVLARRADAALQALIALDPSVDRSPLAALTASVAAWLEDGSIPCACPHPGTADLLYLPDRILRCRECDAEADQRAGVLETCAACGAAEAHMGSAFVVAGVFVVARVCLLCSLAGSRAAPH